MAFQFRVYLPASGIAGANIYIGNTYQTTISSDGSTSAKFNQSNITDSVTVRDVTLSAGYEFSRWIINIDGSTSYSSDLRLDVEYSDSISNVQVRAEVVQVTLYYVTLNYSANGGSGAPQSQSGSTSSSSQYVQFNIPQTAPVRSGYVFLGWSLSSSAASASYFPGGSITLYGSTSGESYTLYAVWQKVSADNTAYIYNGSNWLQYDAYIYNGSSWVKYTPRIYSGGW